MKRVQLWSVNKGTDKGSWTAEDVLSVDTTETENLLESLLVDSPRLLMDGLTLIGRQVPTEGGPLHLLGVDRDGRLVVFELKRGTLTRDAVAQVLDYASDIAGMDANRFAKLIEDNSGRNGIDAIPDFLDWYSQTYPNRDSIFEEVPQMVLVGLGVDQRALRIVDFMVNTGVEISLLTFQKRCKTNKWNNLRGDYQLRTMDQGSGSAGTGSEKDGRRLATEENRFDWWASVTRK